MSQSSRTEESQALQQSLDKLASLEREMALADRDAEVFRIQRTQNIYLTRRDILKDIPKFWYIVLAENDDFAEYIGVEDLKYLEYIANIYVDYSIAKVDKPTEEDLKHFKDFSVTIAFKADDGSIPEQEVTKQFQTITENGEEKIISTPVVVQWPAELESINPVNIKQNKKQFTKDDKKNYRLGMKSFFAWFAWTGGKPGKEFRNGEDLTRLIVDDLFSNALKYYVLALPNDEEDSDESNEEDSSEGEELDLSDDEISENKRPSEANEGGSKRRK